MKWACLLLLAGASVQGTSGLYLPCSECQGGCGGSDSEECWNEEHTEGEFGVCDCDGNCDQFDDYQGYPNQLCSRSESGECQAWGYGAEDCDEMDCNECHNSEECDWGDYFDVLDTNPSGYGYNGFWTSELWEGTTTPDDPDADGGLDAIRMSPGCSVEVMIAGGSTYTYHSDTRLCGNEVGCDNVERVRVFKTETTSGDGNPGSDKCAHCPEGYTWCDGFCDLDGDCGGDDWCEAYEDHHVNCRLDCGENFDSTEPIPVPVQQCRDCSEYKTRNLLFARLPCC